MADLSTQRNKSEIDPEEASDFSASYAALENDGRSDSGPVSGENPQTCSKTSASQISIRSSGERQPLTDKNKTDPGNLGKSLDPVYQSVNP
ncbi:hypothetical protein T265_03541 [Opisthorchis viverrini]|uniref:Uncharacterized protein n=1 Tax=Opisthorchis viverrini TaxID=6198 RepID=A0A074ZRB3_OPIVI|nr:hypothetical protein T265_03541 [Opisthorchis viverrini]KER29953.1 hypothetical protein T265_03541 [Opisthorchis viverrini]